MQVTIYQNCLALDHLLAKEGGIYGKFNQWGVERMGPRQSVRWMVICPGQIQNPDRQWV
jgi:hypothetical protein